MRISPPILLGVTLVLVVTVVATSCGNDSGGQGSSGASSESSPALKSYTNREYRFSVTYPPDLFRTKTRSAKSDLAVRSLYWSADARQEPVDAEVAEVGWVDHMSIAASRYESSAQARRRLKWLADGWEAAGWDVEPARLAGLEGSLVTGECVYAGPQTTRGVHYLLLDGRIGYVISVECDVDTWSPWGERLMEIVRSFKVVE